MMSSISSRGQGRPKKTIGLIASGLTRGHAALRALIHGAERPGDLVLETLAASGSS